MKQLYEEQLPRIDILAQNLGVDRFVIFYDRGQDGYSQTPQGKVEYGAVEAARLFHDGGLITDIFRWDRTFPNAVRRKVPIPAEITDPCEFSGEALGWFRENGWV